MLNSLIESRLLTELLYKRECMIILEANLSYEHIYKGMVLFKAL